MSAEGIDVLAVIDAEIKSLPQIARLMEMAADCEVSVDSAVERLTLARAAVAELVEDMRKIKAAAALGIRHHSVGPGYTEEIAQIADAALARVQGGAA